MKLLKVLKNPRAYALEIQQYLIEEFDDTLVSCDLSMELGFPAVKLIIDLPYYKDSLFLHHCIGVVKSGPGFVARDAVAPHSVIGSQHDTIPALVNATVSIIAIEGPNSDISKSFSSCFKKAYNFSADNLLNDTVAKLMTAILKGKRIKVVDKDPAGRVRGHPPVLQVGFQNFVLAINGDKTLIVER